LGAALATRGLDDVLVVTPDDEVRQLAARAGARPIRQRSQGLNAGLRQAREEVVAAAADALLVVPIDLPLIPPQAPQAPLARPAARVEVIAITGVPEVRPGDDLGRLLGDAIESTPDLTPLLADDVLVVTQKIVSKAEGAIVDLTTVTPRPEAVEFGKRW